MRKQRLQGHTQYPVILSFSVDLENPNRPLISIKDLISLRETKGGRKVSIKKSRGQQRSESYVAVTHLSAPRGTGMEVQWKCSEGTCWCPATLGAIRLQGCNAFSWQEVPSGCLFQAKGKIERGKNKRSGSKKMKRTTPPHLYPVRYSLCIQRYNILWKLGFYFFKG